MKSLGRMFSFWLAIVALIIAIPLTMEVLRHPTVHAQGPLWQTQPGVLAIGNTATSAGGAALTVKGAQLFGMLTGTPTAGQTMTTDTAANICSALGGYGQPGFGWSWDVINTSAGANTITVAGGTGVTMTGTGTAAQNATRAFKWTVVNCTAGAQALTVQSLATGAF